ncbi:MAG: hypothetical protein KDA32_11685 [Phycisphaerales bacterium]|nr:hypothetical protein [Phycisphaerales bacterium]
MTRRRRAYTLIELLAGVVPMIVLLGFVIVVSSDALMLNRRAAAHADRMAIVANLRARLSADVFDAVRVARPDALKIALDTPTDRIEYAFEDAIVTRRVDGAITHVWRADLLTFETRVETGASGAVLIVAARETPPEPVTELVDRTFLITVVLPPIDLALEEAR